MVQNIRKYVFDFSHYITERTQNFAAREWVFSTIDDWLANLDRSRFFLLEGEPGSGKTAIAARLCQISQGAIPQQHLTALTKSSISAIHFCNARDMSSIDPFAFVNSIATQLANCYPAYLNLLNSQRKEQQIYVNVRQNVQQIVNGQAVGVIINVNAPAPETAFNRIVLEPLEVLFRTRSEKQVVILVDALDEALTYSGMSNIVALLAHTDGLSPHVRFILTTRPEEQVVRKFIDVRKVSISIPHDQRCREDISQYVQMRLRNDPLLAVKVEQADHDQVAQLIEVLPLKAEGNFQFVRFLLDSMAKGQRGLMELKGLPTGLGWLYFDSLIRVVEAKRRDWFVNYRPLLGILSIAQESLTAAQLQAFTSQQEGTIWQYLGDLQQFLEEITSQDEHGDIVRRYCLFHESFSDFLHTQYFIMNGVQVRNTFFLSKIEWHEILVDCCEGNAITTIWEDAQHQPLEQGRREYARRHYITHLYQSQKWQRLFAVLDEGTYGRKKLMRDSSMHSYAQDLDLGRQAAASKTRTTEEDIVFLPYIWRYTVLRCGLTSRANQYPPQAFQLLLLLNQESKAIGLANLQTQPDIRARALMYIADYLVIQPGREQEGLQTYKSAWETALSMENTDEKRMILRELAQVWTKKRQWDCVEAIIQSIESEGTRVDVLSEFITALVNEQQWERTEAILQAAKSSDEGTTVLCKLNEAFIKERQWDRAEEAIQAMQDNFEKATASRDLAVALVSFQQWERAKHIVHSIREPDERAKALCALGGAFAQEQQYESAQLLWLEAEAIISTLEDDLRAWPLRVLAEVLIKEQQWERAETIIQTIDEDEWDEKDMALHELVEALIKEQQWERAETIIQTIDEWDEKAKTLSQLAGALYQAGQWSRSEIIWSAAEQTANMVSELAEKSMVSVALAEMFTRTGQQERAKEWWMKAKEEIRRMNEGENKRYVLRKLRKALIKARQWNQAEDAILMIEEYDERHGALQVLAMTLIKAQLWEQAEEVIWKIEDYYERAGLLREQGRALAQVQLLESAKERWKEARSEIQAIKYHFWKAKALCELGIVFAQAQMWIEAKLAMEDAEKEVYFIEGKDRRRPEILREIAKILAQAQQWERTEILIRRIEDTFWQACGWHDLAKALIKAKHWQQAKRAISMIEDSNQKVQAWHLLGITQAQTHLKKQAKESFKEAEKIARNIENLDQRADVLREIELGFAQLQQWRFFLITSKYIKYYFKKNTILHKIMAKMIKSRQRKYAEAIMRTIEDSDEQDGALETLAIRLIQTHQWKCAEAVIYKIRGNSARAEGLCKLALVFAQTQHWEYAEARWSQAQTIIKRIEEPEKRAQMLHVMVTTLIKAQQWKRARAAIRLIERNEESFLAWYELGEALFQAQQQELAHSAWVEAGVIASKMASKWDWKLHTLAGTLIKAKQWEHAESIIQKIEDHDKRAEMLRMLVEAYAQSHQWEQAETIIRMIEKNDEKIRALCALGTALFQGMQQERAEVIWEEAETIAHSITPYYSRAWDLRCVVEARCAAGKWQQALNLVQLSWMQAETSEEAISLFPLALRFVSIKPELGTTLGEAFTWANKFLEG
ncbi:hypothetical protein [Reticulibacter mediterranei]|nr:hypothetical protein [Reticulibacter mediterranei]